MADIQGFPLIDDSFSGATNHWSGTGYESRDYSVYPLAGGKCAQRFAEPLIPVSEYQERIAEKTAKKSWISNLCDNAGLEVKDQSQSSYCWIHGPVHGMEVAYVLSGDPKLVLSAFYAGAIIKGGRNQGGSGITGLEFLTKEGTCLESLHPPMDFSTRNSAAATANAALHKVVLYDDLDATNEQEIITAVLSNIGVTVGIPAWGHEVLLTFLVWEAGKVLFGFDNSWSPSWGTRGRGVLTGSKSRFDEAGAIRVVTPSLT